MHAKKRTERDRAETYQDLSRQVLEDRGQVDGRAAADARGEAALAQEARDTADGELETRLGRARDGLALGALATTTLATSFARHVDLELSFFKRARLGEAAAAYIRPPTPHSTSGATSRSRPWCGATKQGGRLMTD